MTTPPLPGPAGDSNRGWPHSDHRNPYQGYPFPPQFPPGADSQAPYGRDPATGAPLSDKSGVVAGVLQLFFGTLGVGRFYIGTTNIAVAQLVLGLFALTLGWCLMGIPILVSVTWAIVDAIMIFTGSVRDQYGRKLRS